MSASAFYDSTIAFMDPEHKEYNQTKERQALLAELAGYINTINLQDSLQILAKMSEAELAQVINQLIAAEQKKELEKQQLERQNANQRFENNRFGERENNFGQRTSGGKWYFYNPATLSFGYSQFVKKWGKRKKEDDWRRSDKKIATELENDSTTQNQNQEGGRESTNKKDPQYYKDKIPLTKEKIEASNLMIMESHYQAGMIYKNYLSENEKAVKMLVSLCEKFPENKNYTPLAYYNLHLIYAEQNKNNKAQNCREILLIKFPESKYSKLLNEPDYLAKIEQKKNSQKTHYENTLFLYNNKNYSAVIALCDSSLIETENKELKPKYDLLKALAIGKSNDSLNFRKQLNEIVKNHPETEVKQRAEEIIEVLENPEKMQKINHQSINQH